MKIAAIQCNSSDSLEQNCVTLAKQVQQAAQMGASFIALPENAFLMASGESFHQQVYYESEHPALTATKQWVKDHHVSVLIGSLHMKVKDGAKYVNRQYLLAPSGEIVARYDKIHLFDVTIPQGESHVESSRFSAGNKAVLSQMDEATLGHSICYDVRFAALYRVLAKAGANILAIPAAFTHYTGSRGGWHVLCRARAIETGCFVIAPAQCGTHANGRKTYGHSLIINPWGEIIAEASADTPEIITAEIDLAEVAQTRQVMPSLNHDREFSYDPMD